MSQNLNNLDVSNIFIAKSGRSVKLLTKNAEGKLVPVQITTSKMYTPFGVKIDSNQYSSFTNCSVSCSLDKSTTIVQKNKIEELEKKIVSLIKDSMDLFPKETQSITFDDTDSFYCPLLRGNSSYPKLMKLSLPRDKNGNFDFFVFGENKEKIPITDSNIEDVLFKGACFRGIIECSKLWYYNGRIGSTWNVVQLRLEKKTTYNEDSEPQVVPVSSVNCNIMLDDD